MNYKTVGSFRSSLADGRAGDKAEFMRVVAVAAGAARQWVGGQQGGVTRETAAAAGATAAPVGGSATRRSLHGRSRSLAGRLVRDLRAKDWHGALRPRVD